MPIDNQSLVKTINNIDIYKVLSDKQFKNTSVLCVDKNSDIGISFKQINEIIDFGNLIPSEGLLTLSTNIADLDNLSAGAYLFLMSNDNFSIYKKETFGNIEVFNYNSLFEKKVLSGVNSPIDDNLPLGESKKIYVRTNGEIWFSDTNKWNLISDKKTKFLFVNNSTNLTSLTNMFNGDIILNKDTKKISVYNNGSYIEQLDLTSVDLTSNQTIGGNKTFSNPISIPNGISNNDAINLSQLNSIENLINTHELNTSNPHNVTASQIGTYTSIEIDSLLSGKANKIHNHTISQVTGLQTSLDGKADTIHNHTISQVSGLQTSLDNINTDITNINNDLVSINSTLSNKSDVGHTHNTTDVVGLNTALTDFDSRLDSAEGSIVSINNTLPNKSDVGHTHNISDTNGLQIALNNKSYVGHNHTKSEIVGLETDLTNINNDLSGLHTDISNINTSLSNKSDVGHLHNISDVNGLQTSLDGKAVANHNHLISDTTGLQTALDNKSDITHIHTIGQVTNLQTSLDGKASVIHNHEISDVNNLQSALDLKASVNHNHTIAQVTGLQTSLDGKASTIHNHSSDEVFYPNSANTITQKIDGLQNQIDNQSSVYSLSTHTHTGTYEPTIVKVNGYLTWNGTSWVFLNETYALSTHTHGGVYQPQSNDLTAIDGLAGNSGFLKKTALDTWTLDTNSYELANTNIQNHISDNTIHLSSTQKTDLTDGSDSTLHYHSADRDRANHTGTQLSSTISNFSESVDDRVAALIKNGTNITWTYDDVANTLTANVTASGGTPGGSTTQVQYNNAGAFAGATNVLIDNNELIIANNATPVNPPANYVKLFGKNIANRTMLAEVGQFGMDTILQPAIFRQSVAYWNPPGNATTAPGIFGFSNFVIVGTATARIIATTNLLTRTKRIAYVSAATAGSLAGLYTNVAQYTTGDGSGLGGFFFSIRFALTNVTAVNSSRVFVGLSSSITVPTNVDPVTLLNSIGIGVTSTDNTQLRLFYGGSAAQTAIALGTNFPPQSAAGATNGIVYDLSIYAPPNQNGVVHVRVERVGTSFVFETTLTPATVGVQTPASTTLLAPRAWTCNNNLALAVSIDILKIYAETDY